MSLPASGRRRQSPICDCLSGNPQPLSKWDFVLRNPKAILNRPDFSLEQVSEDASWTQGAQLVHRVFDLLQFRRGNIIFSCSPDWKVVTFFVDVASIDAPRYLFLTILDEPRGLPETFGFRAS